MTEVKYKRIVNTLYIIPWYMLVDLSQSSMHNIIGILSEFQRSFYLRITKLMLAAVRYKAYRNCDREDTGSNTSQIKVLLQSV